MDRRSSSKSRAQSKSPSRSKKSSGSTKLPAQPKTERSKSPGRPKSPARSKSPGRPKSTARQKSPARPKSPRPTRSPKHSKRLLKDVKPDSQDQKVSPAEPLPAQRISSDRELSRSFSPVLSSEFERISRRSPFVKLNPSDAFLPESLNSFKSEVESARDRSVSVPKVPLSKITSSQMYSSESSLTLRTSRLRLDGERSSIANENAEGDKILKANNVPIPSSLPYNYEPKYGEKPIREFGNWYGALLVMLLLPCFAIIIEGACTKKNCITINIPSTNWKVYLNLQFAGFYLYFFAWQALLNSLPIGRKASYGQVQVRISGFYNALLTMSLLGGLYYYGFNLTAVLNRSVAILTSAILVSIVLAFLLFFKGRKAAVGHNINADGNKVYDFFIGRELFPTVGPLNIKAMIVRTEYIGVLLLDTLYLLNYKETHASGVNSPTLLFAVATQALYALDTLWFEETFMTTFEAQYEGVGYMTVMAASVWPFLMTVTTRFIMNSEYEAPTYLLVICGILFCAGYFIYRASNSQKAEFRKNPQNPLFSKYETISTFYGKGILCGGWWGLIRHPNYLGDMLMMWSMAAICGLAHWYPYVFALLHSAVLIHRTFRINSRCKTLYGAAWDRYNKIVKYRLIPRVF